MAQLRLKKEKFDRLGAQVVLVGLGTVPETADFKNQFKVPFPMIADPERHLFTAFDLKRASTTELLSLGMAVKGLAALAKGHTVGVPKGDVRQLPGVFIIDPDGWIRYSHHAKGPADHPEPDVLLAVLSSGMSAGK